MKLKRKLAKFLLKLGSILVINDKEFHKDLKHSVNEECTIISVSETGDHLRGDLQPMGNLMAEEVFRCFKNNLKYKEPSSHEKTWAVDEWGEQTRYHLTPNDEYFKDYFGFKIEVGDKVLINNFRIFTYGTVHEIKGSYIIVRTFTDYETVKYPREFINLTKIEEMKKVVYPEDFI